jgi:hypothetical protein
LRALEVSVDGDGAPGVTIGPSTLT